MKLVGGYREQLTHLHSHGYIQQPSSVNFSIPLVDSINNKTETLGLPDTVGSRDLRKSSPI